MARNRVYTIWSAFFSGFIAMNTVHFLAFEEWIAALAGVSLSGLFLILALRK